VAAELIGAASYSPKSYISTRRGRKHGNVDPLPMLATMPQPRVREIERRISLADTTPNRIR
jgi:hypothetical protein